MSWKIKLLFNLKSRYTDVKLSNDNHSNKAGLMLLQSTRILFSINLYYSLWDPPAIRKFQLPHPKHSFDNTYLHQDRLLYLQCCPSAKVHELPQGHCGDNREGTLFLWLHIYYGHLTFVRFEYFVSWITYDHLYSFKARWCFQSVQLRQRFSCLYWTFRPKSSLSKSSLFYPSFSFFINLS